MAPSTHSYLSWSVLPAFPVRLVLPSGQARLIRTTDECFIAALSVNLSGRMFVKVNVFDTASGTISTAELHFKGHRHGGMLHRRRDAQHHAASGAPMDSVDTFYNAGIWSWRNTVLATLLEQALRGRAHDVCAVMASESRVKTIRARGNAHNRGRLLTELCLVQE